VVVDKTPRGSQAKKGKGTRRGARGCELLYLPPYSPDLNPIEEALSKVKHILRKVGARTKEALIEAMGGDGARVGGRE
jgi:transposase